MRHSPTMSVDSPDALLTQLTALTQELRERRVEIHRTYYAYRNGAPPQFAQWGAYFEFVEDRSLHGPTVGAVVLAGAGLGGIALETRRAIRRAIEAYIGESTFTLAMYNKLRQQHILKQPWSTDELHASWAEKLTRDAQVYAAWLADLPPDA